MEKKIMVEGSWVKERRKKWQSDFLKDRKHMEGIGFGMYKYDYVVNKRA